MEPETVKQVREWVGLDNQIRERKEALKQLSDARNELEVAIKTKVIENNLQDSVLKIPDGSIRFVEKSVAQSITLKYLKEQLDKYFRERNPEAMSAEELYRFITDGRRLTKTMDMIRDKKD
jgi:hypothetical protein